MSNAQTHRRVRVFSCGTQHADWECSNCDRCKKNTPSPGIPTCEIQNAVFEAAITDGSFSPEMAARIGNPKGDKFLWPCPEAEWTEEWKAEFRRRRAWRCHVSRRFDLTLRWVVRCVEKFRESRRFRKINRIYAKPRCTRCWADLVCWAISGKDFPEENGEKRCAAQQGGCYCGKFNGKK